jgi:hypothetical protein
MVGGEDDWDIDQLMAAARATATRRQAMLSDRELAEGALNLAGFAVARAEVLTGFDRRLPKRRVKGVRTLVVVPHRDPETAPGSPSPAYLRAVSRALAGRRVLGERLIVRGPKYVQVALTLTLTLDAGALAEQVVGAVGARVGARLWDLSRCDDVAPWPLGRRLLSSEVQALAAGVKGVSAVVSCQLGRVGETLGSAAIDLDRDELAILRADALRIDVQPLQDAGGSPRR